MGVMAKSDQQLADLLFKAYEEKDLESGMMVRAAIQAFVMRPKLELAKKIQAFKAIQAVGVSTDFAKLVSDAFNVTIGTENFDMGWERAFRAVPLGDREDHWDIYDVQNGLTFRLVHEGQRIQVDELSGTLVTVYVDYYGGALGWTDKMIRYRKVAAMIDMASIFRNRFWANKADNHYLLLSAAAAGNVTAYQGVAGDGQLRRDIQTINEAAFVLADRCKDKGYGDTAVAQYLLYCNPRDKARVNAALGSVAQYLAPALGPGSTLQWNVQPIYTFSSRISAGAPILVLPGNKIQAAEGMAPTTFTKPKDPLTLNEVQAVWSIYGAAVGDTDQVQTVTLG